MRVIPAFALVLSVGLACQRHSNPAPVPGTAARQEPPAAAPSANLYARIPDAIGAFRLTERSTVRGLPTDSAFRFRDGSPAILSLIIYNVPPDVQVGADPQQWTPREGEKFRAVQEIRRRSGQISAYAVAFADTSRIADARSTLEHYIAIPVRMPSGAVAVEMQFLYLIDGKFVKVRATIPEQGWEQTSVPSFARALALRLAGGA